MKPFFNFLIYSNLYISLAGSLLYLFYAFTLEANFFLTTPLFVFSGIYLSYHLVRYIPFKKQKTINSEFKNWYQLHPYFFQISMTLALLVAIYGALDLNLQQLFFTLLAFIIVVLYERVLFTKFNLRAISYLKPFVIAFSWSCICVGLQTEVATGKFLFAFFECFIFISLLCIPFDIKDKEIDQIQNVKTLAHIYPVNNLRKTLNYAYFIYTILLLFSRFASRNLIMFGPWVELLCYHLGLRYYKSTRIFYLFIDGVIIVRFLSWFIGNPS